MTEKGPYIIRGIGSMLAGIARVVDVIGQMHARIVLVSSGSCEPWQTISGCSHE